MSYTYPEYLDEMLLVVAACQINNDIDTINLRKIHESRFQNCPDTWLITASSEFHRMGYGIDWQDSLNESFRISGGGLRRAQEIREERETRRWPNRLKKFIDDNWIAFAALVVSIFALFRSGF